MTTNAPLQDRAASSTDITPRYWRQLMSLLGDGKVIPVIGQDAVVIDGANGPRTVSEHIAGLVEAELELEPVANGHPPTLQDVSCRWLEKAGDRNIGELYTAVDDVLRRAPLPIPESLRKLARIEGFSLYVTTTFDDLLQRALNEERFDGAPRTPHYAYSPGRPDKLDTDFAELRTPAVYHLLGRVSASAEFALTEEDTLEYVHSLQSQDRQPSRLLESFHDRSLLLVGSGYSDWLLRFFLRVVKRERLLLARAKTDMIVEARARDDVALAGFLRHFTGQTKVYGGGATAFIDELSERWEEHRASFASTASSYVAPAPASEPDHPIFVSYASEDREIARRLVDALRLLKVPVWFDQGGGLDGGDVYEQKIRDAINRASFFMPLITPSVLTPGKRFFREEWTEALALQRRAAANQPFIIPVMVGNVPPDHPTIDGRMRDLHWIDGPTDLNFDAIASRMRDLYRSYRVGLGAGR